MKTELSAKEPLGKHLRLRPDIEKALLRLHIKTAEDLLLHLPVRYTDPQDLVSIQEAPSDERISISGKILSLETGKTWKGRSPKAEGVLEDIQGNRLKLLWLNQPYMARYFTKGDIVVVTGTISNNSKQPTMINPAVEQTGSDAVLTPGGLFGDTPSTLSPVYAETKGISSRWINTNVKKLLGRGIHENLPDPLPEEVRKELSLPDLATALVWAHAPKQLSHAQSARKRFSFADIFILQTERQQYRYNYQHNNAYQLTKAPKHIKEFLSLLPFTPTNAQKRAMSDIADDLASGQPMCRLLEGDVGSGKTAVAAAVSYATLMHEHEPGAPLQVAIMAPTEILAKQHLETFIELFKNTPIRIGFLSSSGASVFPSKINPNEGTRISKPQLKKWLADGTVRLLIGTHALIQKSVTFKHLALAIIDEQHRFGLAQRKKLTDKDTHVPHLLSMTATPIPRTLALTLFGDLDLSVLDELPKGRKQTITKVVAEREREELWEILDTRLENGEQAFVVCPRINAADPNNENALTVRSAKESAELLTKKLPHRRVQLIHGKLKPAEKDALMQDFARGTTDVLVSTSVVEVGVDVPNATIMIIEGAERFGLAQLHQLRGRVGRGNSQAYCYLVPTKPTSTALKRLTIVAKTSSGFVLAEHDLANRGTGGITTTKQWGMSDIAMDALQNIKLVEYARKLAHLVIKKDPTLKKHPVLQEEILRLQEKLHLE